MSRRGEMLADHHLLDKGDVLAALKVAQTPEGQ